MIYSIIILISILLVTIIVHEAGHVASSYMITGSNPSLTISRKEITIYYKKTTELNNIVILLTGIMSGVLVLFVLLDIFFTSDILKSLTMISYVYGCKWDIVNIAKSFRVIKDESNN